MSNDLIMANKMLNASETQAKAQMRIAEVLENIWDVLREMNDRQRGGRPGEGQHPFSG